MFSISLQESKRVVQVSPKFFEPSGIAACSLFIGGKRGSTNQSIPDNPKVVTFSANRFLQQRRIDLCAAICFLFAVMRRDGNDFE